MTGIPRTANSATIVRCPGCGKGNRVPRAPRGAPRCGSCRRMLPWLVEATAATVEQELRASVPVLLDLWAPWCGPCRVMAPTLARLAADRAGRLKVVKVNIDTAPAVAARFGAYSIPLLVLTDGGRELARRVGAASPHQLAGWLDSQLAAAAR